MKNFKISLFVASLSIAFQLASPARANNWNDEIDAHSGDPLGPAWELSILGGAAHPVGDNSNGLTGDYGSSGLFQVSMIHNFGSTFGFGMEFGRSFNHSFDFNMSPYSQYWLNPKDDVEITQFTPVMQVGKWFGGIKPYMALGAGLYNVRETLSFNGPYYPINGSFHSNYLGFNVGGGLLARVGKNLAIGPDMRYHQIVGDESFNFQYVTTTLRVALLF